MLLGATIHLFDSGTREPLPLARFSFSAVTGILWTSAGVLFWTDRSRMAAATFVAGLTAYVGGIQLGYIV